MKTQLTGIALSTLLLLAVSCSNDTAPGVPDPNNGTVTFNISLDKDAPTRGISDGKSIDELIYQVYDSTTGEAVGSQGTAEITGESIDVDISFHPGTYYVVFWAQNSGCLVFDTQDLTNVSLKEEALTNNAETMDAFFGSVEVKVDSGVKGAESVTLTRPFAQINIVSATIPEVYTTSGVTIDGAYTAINLLTGKVVGEPSEVTYKAVEMPSDENTIEIEGKEYQYVSTTYVLASEEAGETVDVTLDLGDGEDHTYGDQPMQRNHRTNIVISLSEVEGPTPPEELEPIDMTFDFASFTALETYFPGLPPYTDWTADGNNKKYTVAGRSFEVNDVNIDLEKGTSNDCVVYWIATSSNYELRLYANNVMILSVPESYKMTKIVFKSSAANTQINKMKLVDEQPGNFVNNSSEKTMTWEAGESIGTNILKFTTTGTTRIETIEVQAEPIE